ncbi:unnamed protein product [Paramecium octaurelia]|uniref:Uncharacterized protein n=1 Tax=Paramecium octaurelia TaxID=43137 RepID=A0A8S1UGP2_PAROT|nr:unnamed protein product [Paramecium octaurelia]
MKILILNLLYLIIQCQPNEVQSSSNNNYDSSESSSREQEYDQNGYPIEHNENGGGLTEFLAIIFIAVLIAIVIPRIKESEKEVPAARNQNKNNLDELNQTINSIAQKLQEGKLEMSFTFNDLWVSQKIEKVTVSQDGNELSFRMYGQDRYGSWTQFGRMNINQFNQIETFSRKMYEEAELHKGDELVYQGQFDDSDQSIRGDWYYVKSKQRGKWVLKLK